jgi:hypothetical protein
MEPSSPQQFLKSFIHSWGSLVSGTLSVPFTIAALLSKDHEQAMWGLLALAAIIVAAYYTWKKAYDELVQMKTPDISVLFDANDLRCRPPVFCQTATNPAAVLYPTTPRAGIYIQQACIVAENISSIQIDHVEFYCEEIRVVKPTPETYVVRPAGSERPIYLCPGEPIVQGIIREIVERGDNGVVSSKRIDLTLPYKPHRQDLKGSEFLVRVLIVGKNLYKPKRQTYRFGDRDGTLIFEEHSD